MLEPGATIEFVLSEGPGLVIPDYSDVKKEDASTYVQGFSVTVKLVYNMTVPYGGFISQSVTAGTRVHKGENAVTITYSIGKPYLPNLVGMRESDLPELFYEINRKGAHLSYIITYVNSTQTKGTVVEASHSLEAVELDTLVDLRVSNGLGTATPDPGNSVTYVIVPDYSQVLKENAAAVNHDISVNIVMNYSDTVPYGKLISQSVKAGYAVTSTENQVTLVYSAGKPYIDNLVGKNENELAAIFYEYSKMGANVTYVVTYVDNAAAKGTVVAVSKSNEYISTTEVIQIQVSKG
jgi:beta-lactam-binding protein with PASTA domain